MKKEAKLIKESLPQWWNKHVTITEVKQLPSTLLIETPFETLDGNRMVIYAYKRPKSNKLYLSDGGRMVKSLEDLIAGRLVVLQKILETYGLKLTEDNSVLEDSARSLGVRLTMFISACIAVDGVSRARIATTEWMKEQFSGLNTPQKEPDVYK